MTNQYLDSCFMRLVHNMKNNKTKEKNITLMLGAGCSLTSSPKDVTTHGIIESLVRQYSIDGSVPDSWEELYKCFVNNVWQGQGEYDRIQLLEDYFADMTPSAGYQAMRWLIENNYVNHIITTNFDPMIDESLEGLSYRLVVGEHKEVVGNNTPAFTLMKIHGDLKFGHLRFAPNQLSKLPDHLSDEIRKLTSGVVLVVGYRGQDLGLLHALDTCEDHGAFWSARTQPDSQDSYENEQIYTWMKKRNSIPNFLYGDTYGRFDQLFTKLKETLTALASKDSLQRSNRFNDLWKGNQIFDYFRLNQRFLTIFEQTHRQLEIKIQNDLWRITEPYCAPNYEVLLMSLVNQLQANIIPEEYMYCISNEVDALVFSLSCSICCVCQGYPYTAQELIGDIRSQYEQEGFETSIGKEFWEAVLLLSNTNLLDDTRQIRFDDPLSFYFDRDGNMQTVLKHVDLQGMHNLLSTTLALLLFVHTSTENSPFLVSLKYKQTLETHLYEIQCYDSLIRLQMSKIPLDAYQDIYQMLQKYHFLQTKIEREHVLHRDILRVSFMVEDLQTAPISSMWEALEQRAKQSFDQFQGDFIPESFTRRQSITVFCDFIEKPTAGLFLVGESGSGKTTLLRQWLSQLVPSEFLAYPISGRDIHKGWEQKNDILFRGSQLQYIQIMLEQRSEILLIVIDAINEIRGTFAEIVKLYTDLLDFGDRLSRENYTRIKLVISCRNDFYTQLKKSSGKEPSSSSFYTPDTTERPQSIVQLPLLSEVEINQFLTLYQFPKRITMGELQTEFGELIYLPINLKIICDAHEVGNAPTQSGDPMGIYAEWFRGLIHSAEKDAIPAERLWAVVFATIRYRFFEAEDGEALTHRLSTDLSGKFPGVLAAFEWLVVHKLFTRSDSNPNLIQFTHDRLEEHFLSQYILKVHGNALTVIDQALAGECLTRPIVKRALCGAILALSRSDKLAFLTSFVTIIRNKNDLLLPVWGDALLQKAKESPEDACMLLRELEQYLLKSEYRFFLYRLLLQMRQMLDDRIDVGRAVVDTIGGVVQNCLGGEPLFKVLSHYLMSKQRYLFPGEDDKQAFRDSLALCKEADSCLSKEIPDSLMDDFQTLEALLLQNQGLLNESIALMEDCHRRQTKYAMYDLACQSALYLGAMYRDLTLFDDAIKLYDSLDTNLIVNPLYRHRLMMNTGIIYKNKIQNAMFSGQWNTDENRHNYRMALDKFKTTCVYAEQNDDVKLCLEIYAERVELACIAYYLDMGTIMEATEWAKKIDDVIPRYRLPVPRIQRHRMWARVQVLERDYAKAIGHLEKGFTIAVDYNIPFRATDCCNQITGLICDMIGQGVPLTQEILDKGLTYGTYAIDYYKQLNRSNHRYLQDALAKYEKILGAQQNFSTET